MTTSGSYDFTVNRNELIAGALRLCGVIAQGETPTTSQYSEASTFLNSMVKAWEAEGMPIWAITTTTLTPVAGQTAYTLNNPKLLKCIQAWNRNTSSLVDIPMRIITRQEYNILGNKSTTGNPIQLYFQPNRDDTTVYLFPTPDSTSASQNVIYIVAQRPFQDFDASTDTPDFPQEWFEAVMYGLAQRLAGVYNIDVETRKMIAMEATAFKQQALSFGNEEGSLYFQRDWRSW
jgi:hypothetical protein